MSRSESDLHRYSYEAFATNPVIRDEVDLPVVREIPVRVNWALDLGTGIGEVIRHLINEGKLESPYRVSGVDLDQEALTIAADRLKGWASGEDEIVLIHGNAEELEISSSSQELVTCLNMIHLTDAQKVIAESHRVLIPGGFFAVSSAYEKDNAYPDEMSKKMWGMLLAFARRSLKQEFPNLQDPIDRFIYTRSDLRQFAEKEGFRDVRTDYFEVEMDLSSMKAICSYREFAQGALPGIPFNRAADALVDAVEPVLERFHAEYFRRNWMVLFATA